MNRCGVHRLLVARMIFVGLSKNAGMIGRFARVGVTSRRQGQAGRRDRALLILVIEIGIQTLTSR